VAAFVVHQLRYVLAFGWNDGAELRMTGHSYVHSVVPWLVLLLALVAGGFLHAIGRALGGQRTLSRCAVSFTGLWLLCSTALVAIFACQEFLEGLFATGHPAGLAGVFGYGGWWAIPAALCVGLILASLFHGALWVLDEVAKRRARPLSATGSPPAQTVRRPDVSLPQLAPLAYGWSGRGPPH
jgi:H+/gluconate symporter-like permease